MGSVICCTLVANTGYLGYPLVAALLGFDRLSEAVIYDVLVAAPALLWARSRSARRSATRRAKRRGERVVAFFTRNPPLYAAALALIAPDSLAPDVAGRRIANRDRRVLPLGFFAVGAALAEEAEEGTIPVPPPLDAAVAAAVGLGWWSRRACSCCSPLPLIDLPGPYLLLAAMPCGINTMIVTHAYGLDLRISASAVAWSTAIAVVVAVASLAL